MNQREVIIKMLFCDAYFIGPREIMGYIKIDPNITLGVFVEECLEEVERVILDTDSLKESFEAHPAFTEQEAKELFKDRPDNLSATLSRLSEFSNAHEKVTVETTTDSIELTLDLGDGLIVKGTRKAFGCLKMDSTMTCEKFIKTKIDPFMRTVIGTQLIKDSYASSPAFDAKDCEKEFSENPKMLKAAKDRLRVFYKQKK
jgi:hypothetical protein